MCHTYFERNEYFSRKTQETSFQLSRKVKPHVKFLQATLIKLISSIL